MSAARRDGTASFRVEGEPAFRTRHANPYNARLYEAVIAQGIPVRELSYLRLVTNPPEIVHLHWPDLTFLSGPRTWRILARLVLFFGFLTVARLRRGTRLVWTVHNVNSHETRGNAPLRALYRRLLTSNTDAFLALSQDGIDATRAAYPEFADVPGYVTPHGHYRLDYDLTVDKQQARRTLGVAEDATLVVSVGMIRPYKNIPTLIREFGSTPLPGNTVLAVAGKAGAGLREEIDTAAAGQDSVLLELEFLSPERIALWLRASDLVVLPYRAIQNSGSAILALSAERRVLVPSLGAMDELAAQIGDDWVRTYPGEFSGAELASALEWAAAADPTAVPDLAPLEWDAIAAATIQVYRTTLETPRPAPPR